MQWGIDLEGFTLRKHGKLEEGHDWGDRKDRNDRESSFRKEGERTPRRISQKMNRSRPPHSKVTKEWL